MANQNEPLTTSPGVPFFHLRQVGKMGGATIHFTTVQDWKDGVTYANLGSRWPEGQRMTRPDEAGTPAVRVYRGNLQHARTVLLGLFSIVLGSDENKVHGLSGTPGGSVGIDGDLSVDPTTGTIYIKANGAWSQWSSGAILAPTLVSAPVISGTPQVGQTLSATAGVWLNSPTAFARQWRRNGTPISGAIDSTYVPVTADIGATLTISVLASNAAGPADQPAISVGVGPVQAATVPAPVNQTPPSLTGAEFRVGVPLTVNVGTWSNSPTSYSTQVLRNGVEISGATGSTYTPVQADVDTLLSVRVIATNGTPSSPATSSSVGPILNVAAPANTSPPTIVGTAQVGQTLTGNDGTWSGTPTSYARRWLRNGVAISGATGTTYVPTLLDIGNALRFEVTATGAGGTGAPALSAATSNTAPAPTTLPAVTTVNVASDSFGVGVDSSAPLTLGWVPLMMSSMGATALNQSVSGSVLQNSPDAGGSPRANNLRDTFISAMTGANARQFADIARGFNDARYVANPSQFNATSYRNDLSEIVAGLRQNGYAANRILITSPWWISDEGLTIGSTGFAGQTREVFETFVAQARSVAEEYGTFYCDIYAAMRDNGGVALMSTDKYHPNDLGHSIIRYAKLSLSTIVNTRASSPISVVGGVNKIDYTLTSASDAIGYQIERGNEGSFAFGNSVTVTNLTGSLTGLSGGTYRVRARPIFSGGLYGPWQQAASSALVTTSGGGTLFLDDTFTDADGTLLTAHVAEIGGTAQVQFGFTPTGGGSVIANNRLYARGNAGVYQYQGATPPSENYEVDGYFECVTVVANEDVGIAGRMHPSIANLLFARYQRSSGNWQLFQTLALSTNNQLGSNVADSFPVGETRRIKMVMNGQAITVTIYGNDGVTVIGTITATAQGSATGFPGVRHAVGSGGTQSPTTGTQITRVTAGPIGSSPVTVNGENVTVNGENVQV